LSAVSGEATAEAYTIGQVAAGLPFANAVATGHAHNPGYIAYTSYPAASLYAGSLGYAAVPYGAGLHYIGKRSAEAYTLGQVAAGVPYAQALADGRAHNPGYIAYVSYPGVGVAGHHYLGKRSAEAYTIGQVAAGVPFANAVATGHAHNPGYIAYTEYPASSAGYVSYAGLGVYGAGYALPFFG
jgi:hypothetical protein